MFSEADILHVMRMVLNDNRGNTLTEALGLGIETSVLHYLKQITPGSLVVPGTEGAAP